MYCIIRVIIESIRIDGWYVDDDRFYGRDDAFMSYGLQQQPVTTRHEPQEVIIRPDEIRNP